MKLLIYSMTISLSQTGEVSKIFYTRGSIVPGEQVHIIRMTRQCRFFYLYLFNLCKPLFPSVKNRPRTTLWNPIHDPAEILTTLSSVLWPDCIGKDLRDFGKNLSTWDDRLFPGMFRSSLFKNFLPSSNIEVHRIHLLFRICYSFRAQAFATLACISVSLENDAKATV